MLDSPSPSSSSSLVHLFKSISLKKSRSILSKKKTDNDDARAPRPRGRSPNPRALDHSRLPTELWLLILRDATLMTPDPFEATDDDLSFLDAHPVHPGAYAHAMRIKTSLSLVSKRFAELSRPFLYEFVWISRAAQAKALAHRLLLEYVSRRTSSGRFVRRLHIETPVLERCAPEDLHTILEYSPQLTVYADHRSVQRNCNRGDVPADPRCEPAKLLSLLAHPRSELRRLSWTSYDDGPFHLRMSPLREMRTMRLEYLELSSCSPNLHALIADYAPSTATTSAADVVCLPALKSLKASLDNDMFAVLAGWDMPALRNLSVLSADFSYTGPGFYAFFTAHGSKLRQLELGHSSSTIEEHYLTRPPPPPPDADWSLARACPELRELVCSADAEWQWHEPDWIAPHVLLPAHPKIEMIAVRDVDARVRDAISASSSAGFFPLLEQMSSVLNAQAFPALKYLRDLSVESAVLRDGEGGSETVKFWGEVLGRCKERGVWLEDWRGINVTQRALLRASMRAVSGGEAW